MEKIPDILKELESKHDIKILFSLEAGSRAWMLESEDSDYDIRFIYRYNDIKKYLSIKSPPETIDGFSDDRLYDWQGWDIRKAILFLQKMNPSLCEWLYSPIIYYNDLEANFQSLSKQLLQKNFRVIPLLYHYKSMAKKNFKLHIDNKDNVKIKKYLYVIRPAGMFIWLLNSAKNSTKKSEQNVDPSNFEINFLVILDAIKETMTEECYSKINEIIVKKKTMKELDFEPRIKSIDEWIKSVLDDSYQENINNLNKLENENSFKSSDEYDQILFSILNV